MHNYIYQIHFNHFPELQLVEQIDLLLTSRFHNCSKSACALYLNKICEQKTNINQIFYLQSSEPVDFSFNPDYEAEFKFYDKALLDSVKANDPNAHIFFRLLALCHTVMPEEKNGRLEYQVNYK